MPDPTADAHDIAGLHRRALRETRRWMAGVADHHWDLPTPCDSWTVRELVNHVVVGNWWAAELASGRTIDEVGDRLDGDRTTDDPLREYDRSAEAAARAFERPGALEAPCAVSYGPVPGSVYAGHRFIDVLIHGWDLAVATGQPTRIDPELVEACWEQVEPQLSMLQSSGMFGEAAPVHAADRQTQLLHALGRRPGSDGPSGSGAGR